MAYQTGSATSINDLMAQLAAWLVSRGWISDNTAATEFHGHKSGLYVHLKVTASGIPWSTGTWSNPTFGGLWIYLSTAYTAGSYTASTTGAIKNTSSVVVGNGIPITNGANTSYHFFDDGNDNIAIVVERTPGVFSMLGFGLSLTKHGGNWTGGAYCFGQLCAWYSAAGTAGTTDSTRPPFHYSTYTSWNECSGFIRADVDSFTGKYLGCSGTTNANSGYTGRSVVSWIGGNEAMPYAIPNDGVWINTSATNGQVVLTPIRLFAPRDAGGYGLLATVPSIFGCNGVGNGYSNGNEVTIGADTYKIFSSVAIKKVA